MRTIQQSGLAATGVLLTLAMTAPAAQAGSGSYDSNDVGQLIADLSNTLTVGYQGPQCTPTASSSGVFPDTDPTSPVATPEPASLTLLLPGPAGCRMLLRLRGPRLTSVPPA